MELILIIIIIIIIISVTSVTPCSYAKHGLGLGIRGAIVLWPDAIPDANPTNSRTNEVSP